MKKYKAKIFKEVKGAYDEKTILRPSATQEAESVLLNTEDEAELFVKKNIKKIQHQNDFNDFMYTYVIEEQHVIELEDDE